MTKVAVLSDFDLRPRAIGGSTIVRYMLDALALAGCEPSIWFAPHASAVGTADFGSSRFPVVDLPVTPPQSAFPLKTAAPALFRDILAAFDAQMSAGAVDLLMTTNPLTPGLWPFEAAIELGLPYVIMLMDYSFLCPIFTRMRSTSHFCRGNVPEAECIACTSGRLSSGKRAAFSALRAMRTVAGPLLAASPWRHGLYRYYAGNTTMRAARRGLVADVFRRAAAVIFQTDVMQQEYHNAGFTNDREFVVTFGVPASSATRPARGTSHQFTFAYCSRPTPEWGLHVLVDLWNKRFARRDDVRLLVASPGAQSYLARCRVPSGDSANVRFSDELIQGRLPEFYAGVDCCVIPAQWRGVVPLTALESLSCGVPVLTPSYSGPHDLPGVHAYDGTPDDLMRMMNRTAKGAFDTQVPHSRTIADWGIDLQKCLSSVTDLNLSCHAPTSC